MADMPARLIAYRIAIARRALRGASSAADRLPALAALVGVASDIRADDLGGAGPARARLLFDEAVAYLSPASALLPVGGDDHRVALYLLARACLGRDAEGAVPDADNAIVCLRRLRTALPAADPDRTEVEALLTNALLDRAVSAGGRASDVDEAAQLLTSMLAAAPAGHPGRRLLTAALAQAHAVRYIGFEGTAADRDAALAYATATLGGPDGPDEPEATAHLVLAWMTLTRQHTPQQRSSMLRPAEIEAARHDGEAAARLLAAFGEVRISAADAEATIAHLRRIPPGVGSAFVRSSVPALTGLAQLALIHSGAAAPDTGPVAEALVALTADPEFTETERAEMLALRATLLTAQAETGAVDALGDAATGLPAGHLLRPPILAALSHMLGQEMDGAGSADDLVTRLDQVGEVLDGLPHDDPEAAHALITLGARILNASGSNRNVFQQDRLFDHIDRLAADLAPGDPLAPLAEFMVWSSRHVRAHLTSDTQGADAALKEMIGRADLVPAGHVARPFALSSVAAAYMQRPMITGELRNLDLAAKFADDAITEAEAAPDGHYRKGTNLHGYLLYLRGHLRAMRAVYSPTLTGAEQAIEDLELAETEIGEGEAARLGLIVSLGTARILREQLANPAGPYMTVGPEASDTFDRLLEAAQRAGPDSIDYPVLAGQAGAGLMIRGVATHDLTLIDRAVELFAGICAIPTLGLGERPRALEQHGDALRTRYSITRDPRDLGNAIARLEEARRAVQQEPGSPLIGSVLQTLAGAYRTRGNAALGDVDRAVRAGLDGLRENAGDVLLQDNDDNALQMARRVTNDATEMARWFLTRGRPEAAISAIELGRGMVLHAATSGTPVAEALAEAGHRELALEWTAQARRPAPSAPGRLMPGGYDEPARDNDLRYQVMLALEGTAAEARLLSPPTVADIAAALAGADADALVYLLPRDDTGAGIAVIVDGAGTVSWLPLFRLRVGDGTEVGEFLRTRRAVERAAEAAGPAAPAAFDAARADWLLALDAVCDWAWQAAVGPLLRELAKHADASHRADTAGPRRIVLVPGGELGLIPWHAARRPVRDGNANDGNADGSRAPGGRAAVGAARHEYACRQAVFSYASSARQFIDAARQGRRPWRQSPVLVSDADDSLYLAMVEIAHLHAAHYANGAVYGSARYLLADPGAPGQTAVRPADVLDALPHGDIAGASVLHFGCHGLVRVPVLGSSLHLGWDRLSGPWPGEEISLSVSDFLRQARAGRAQPRGGGLVVLAACVSDVTETDYDEALTLATAFLAAGSAGVVATRWSVPDRGTALFMAAFHRFLNEGDGDPARALREAQLWMLDPDREVPASWRAELRDEAGLDGRPGGPDLTSIETWAGFTYQGR